MPRTPTTGAAIGFAVLANGSATNGMIRRGRKGIVSTHGAIERGAFSPTEAAEWLGVSLATTYRLMKSGQLPFTKLGARRLIARTTLERLVDPEKAPA